MGISGKKTPNSNGKKNKITKKTYKKDDGINMNDGETKSSLKKTTNNKETVTTGTSVKANEQKDDLNKIMDPTPEAVIEAIRKGKEGDACYRLSLCETSTVASLKEFLSYIPDDTLVRIGGQNNGFVQMDTTYPDLNFCVPEEQGCCDEKSSTMTLSQSVIDYADYMIDMICQNDVYKNSFDMACETLGFNPHAIWDLVISFSESTTETEVESSLYKKLIMVIGLMHIFYADNQFDASNKCPEKCPVFVDAFRETLDEEHVLMKSLCKIGRISMSTDIHIIPRRKKNKRGFKKLNETDTENIIKTIIPSDVSEFSVTMPKHGSSMHITYRTDDTNPFGKVPTFCGIPFDQIHIPECAEECIAYDGCNSDEEPDEEPKEDNQCECLETQIADAQCVEDDDANDDD